MNLNLDRRTIAVVALVAFLALVPAAFELLAAVEVVVVLLAFVTYRLGDLAKSNRELAATVKENIKR